MNDADKKTLEAAQWWFNAPFAFERRGADSWTKANVPYALIALAESLDKRVVELEAALVADVTDLWNLSNKIRESIQSHSWIAEGRGSYEWDDERYREETGRAFSEILGLIKGVQRPASTRFLEVLRAPGAALKSAAPEPSSAQ